MFFMADKYMMITETLLEMTYFDLCVLSIRICGYIRQGYIILMFIADLQSFDIFYLTIVVKRVVPHILSIAISLAYHACKFRPSYQEGFAKFLKFVPFI